MSNILRKLTSRKFLLAVAGMAAGYAMAFGVDGSEIVEIVGAVGGILAAVSSAIAYINAEAKVDAANKGGDGE